MTKHYLDACNRQLTQFESNPNEVSRGVSQIISHPDYNSATSDNDIALLRLSASVNFTDFIRPVCLAAANSTFYNGTDSWYDGGAPMMSKPGSRWIQSGVFITTFRCLSRPSVFTRVSQYQDWINSHITTDQPGFVTFTSSGTDGDLSVSCSIVPPITTNVTTTVSTAPTATTNIMYE
ncbi:chymotrypsin-like protease CTRL-1 [Chanos chanos]|uniref:Chymotrypsin-like protease CTRL-1 n=1 Tax=Chanos chanos TaxID=29144 RepID=A0A6J2WZQ3_CHACN|nr:chymotrypsin-like protease CTRL-1 [Chanos chanos]